MPAAPVSEAKLNAAARVAKAEQCVIVIGKSEVIATFLLQSVCGYRILRAWKRADAQTGETQMLNINILEDHHMKLVATVDSMAAARDYLDEFCSKCRNVAKVVDFEVDGDCADALIANGPNLIIFTIEAA